LFIILAYYGSFSTWVDDVQTDEKEPTEFIKNYIKELKNIGILISDAKPEIVKIVKSLNKTNEKGTVVSLFLQDLERQMLEIMYDYLTTNKYIQNKICILCFDGLMMETQYFKEELLKELNEHVLKVSGFNLTFTTKPLDKHLLNDLPRAVDETSYEYVKTEFEKTNCKIREGSIYATLGAKDGTYSFISHDACTKRFCDYKYIENGKKESFIKRWLYDENIRAYEDTDLFPNADKCPDNIFNLWTPFECEKYTEPYEHHQEGLDVILNLIMILCNNEQPICKCLCNWIGQMLVHPDIKTFIITLISSQGAGKTTLILLLEKMIGHKKVIMSTNPKNSIWGEFNGLLMDSFLINLNELSKKDTIEAEGIIKGLITDSTITINKKGVNQITIKSYHRFIITTNKDEPINTSKDDRRNLIIRSVL
jgi:hypothetical protein